jgi:hypothetical protein
VTAEEIHREVLRGRTATPAERQAATEWASRGLAAAVLNELDASDHAGALESARALEDILSWFLALPRAAPKRRPRPRPRTRKGRRL